jgi:hypothetical protein
MERTGDTTTDGERSQEASVVPGTPLCAESDASYVDATPSPCAFQAVASSRVRRRRRQRAETSCCRTSTTRATKGCCWASAESEASYKLHQTLFELKAQHNEEVGRLMHIHKMEVERLMTSTSVRAPPDSLFELGLTLNRKDIELRVKEEKYRKKVAKFCRGIASTDDYVEKMVESFEQVAASLLKALDCTRRRTGELEHLHQEHTTLKRKFGQITHELACSRREVEMLRADDQTTAKRVAELTAQNARLERQLRNKVCENCGF